MTPVHRFWHLCLHSVEPLLHFRDGITVYAASRAGLYGLMLGPSASGVAANMYFDKTGVVSASLRMASSLDLGAALQQLGMALPVDVSDVLVIVNPQVSVVSSRAASLGVSNGTWPGVRSYPRIWPGLGALGGHCQGLVIFWTLQT